MSSLIYPRRAIASRKLLTCSAASELFALSIISLSSVTNLPDVRWEYTSPCRSSSCSARCIVFGFTPASAARSRTEASRSPGESVPAAIPSLI